VTHTNVARLKVRPGTRKSCITDTNVALCRQFTESRASFRCYECARALLLEVLNRPGQILVAALLC